MNYKAIPPDRTKYKFCSLNPGEELQLEGKYELIRNACRRFADRHKIVLKCVKVTNNKVTIYRPNHV